MLDSSAFPEVSPLRVQICVYFFMGRIPRMYGRVGKYDMPNEGDACAACPKRAQDMFVWRFGEAEICQSRYVIDVPFSIV